MLHCCLDLARLALPSTEAKEGHLRPVAQGEGGLHPRDELQAHVAPAVDCRETYTTAAITLG